MKKQCFNLVEIILALGVIAVGMTGVLVLFPTGLNSVNSATADNSVPDAAQYLAGYLESCIRRDWRNGVNTTWEALPAVTPAAEESFNSTPVDNTPIYTSTSLTAGIFKYEQVHTVDGASVVDFSAAARVWTLRKENRSGNHIHVPGQTSPVWMKEGAFTIFIEMSYPLTKPYEDREKQTYRFDLYDYGA